MKRKFVFYANDFSVNVYEKNQVTSELKKKLRSENFHKMPFEASAENEADATDMMMKHFKDNIDMLREFANDYAISYTIFGAIYALSS